MLRLVQSGAAVVIRVPVIPAFNMDIETLSGIVDLAGKLGITHVNFLPYHRYAQGKYTLLGRKYWHPGVEKADVKDVAALAAQICSKTVEISIGG